MQYAKKPVYFKRASYISFKYHTCDLLWCELIIILHLSRVSWNYHLHDYPNYDVSLTIGAGTVNANSILALNNLWPWHNRLTYFIFFWQSTATINAMKKIRDIITTQILFSRKFLPRNLSLLIVSQKCGGGTLSSKVPANGGRNATPCNCSGFVRVAPRKTVPKLEWKGEYKFWINQYCQTNSLQTFF